jgi:regulator of sigma E protease
MSWVLALAGLMALIVLHELGHFLVAKAVGMRVERFSLFFPPMLFKVKWGETEYGIGAIPLGGYVKITGMSPEELDRLAPVAATTSVLPGAVAVGGGEEDPAEAETLHAEIVRRAYYNQAPWKRIVVILAGPGVNLLIAFLLFWAVLFAGNLNADAVLTNLNPSILTLQSKSAVAEVLPRQPADGVLKPGDRIISVDGRKATVVSTQAAIVADRCAGKQLQGCRAARPVQLIVRRGPTDVALSIYPRYDQAAEKMLVGFDFGVAAKPFGAVAAAKASLREMWVTTKTLFTHIGKAFTSSKVRHEFTSVVGLTEGTQEAVAAGTGQALVILGYISLVLGVMNLLPFLPLDGGHVMWALAEKVRGRRVSLMAMWRFSSVGLVLLAFLVISSISNDVGRLGG